MTRTMNAYRNRIRNQGSNQAVLVGDFDISVVGTEFVNKILDNSNRTEVF